MLDGTLEFELVGQSWHVERRLCLTDCQGSWGSSNALSMLDEYHATYPVGGALTAALGRQVGIRLRIASIGKPKALFHPNCRITGSLITWIF